MLNSKRKSLILGVGINDAQYNVHEYHYVEEGGILIRKKLWSCPYYDTWKDMLGRCYSSKFQSTHKGAVYVNCTVDPSWHLFSNFKAWMEQQIWMCSEIGKLCLDKDLITPGNKVYSEENCSFIPSQLNKLLLTRQAMRGSYSIGVSLHACGKYMAQCSSFGHGRTYLGLYAVEREAHRAWQKAKITSILSALEWYRNLDCYLHKVDMGCMLRVRQMEADLANNAETLTI